MLGTMILHVKESVPFSVIADSLLLGLSSSRVTSISAWNGPS